VILTLPGEMPLANPELSTVAAFPELEKVKMASGMTLPC